RKSLIFRPCPHDPFHLIEGHTPLITPIEPDPYGEVTSLCYLPNLMFLTHHTKGTQQISLLVCPDSRHSLSPSFSASLWREHQSLLLKFLQKTLINGEPKGSNIGVEFLFIEELFVGIWQKYHDLSPYHFNQ